MGQFDPVCPICGRSDKTPCRSRSEENECLRQAMLEQFRETKFENTLAHKNWIWALDERDKRHAVEEKLLRCRSQRETLRAALQDILDTFAERCDFRPLLGFHEHAQIKAGHAAIDALSACERERPEVSGSGRPVARNDFRYTD